MHSEFGADLRVARRRCGLSQEDCAHLLGVRQPLMSKLEAGKVEPSAAQLAILYIVLGEGARPLWNGYAESVAMQLRERLSSMPDCPQNWPEKELRRVTIHALATKLADVNAPSL